jgi:ATP-dependent DNA ligase
MKLTEFKYFYPERAGLMHKDQPLFETLSNNPDWIAEPKYNGSRLQLHYLPDNSWQFWNRHGQKMSYTPSPELLHDLNGLKLRGYWLLDGELRHNKVKGVNHRVVIYDVFVADGIILSDIPFIQRRLALEQLFKCSGPSVSDILDLTWQYSTNFRQEFDKYKDNQEIEGLVIKNLKGKLNLGRTSSPKSTWQWKVRKANNSVRF